MNSSTQNQDSNLVESLLDSRKPSTPLTTNSIIEKPPNEHQTLAFDEQPKFLNTVIESNQRTVEEDNNLILCGSNDKITMSPLKMSHDSS